MPDKRSMTIEEKIKSDEQRLSFLNQLHRTSIHAIRRTYSSMMQANGCSRLMVSTLLGHTPKTNESHYSYDVTSLTSKIEVIQAMSSNVVKFRPRITA